MKKKAVSKVFKMFLWLLLGFDLLLLGGVLLFTYESVREKEPRAPKIGLALAGGCLLLAGLLVFLPLIHIPVAVLFSCMVIMALVFMIPGKPNPRAMAGSKGCVQGEFARFDERDSVFARNRSLPEGSERYRNYYETHPEKEETDRKRRAKGGPVAKAGSIDNGYQPNVAMMGAGFGFVNYMGPHARVEPGMETAKVELDPARATRIVKGLARHLGADLVGVCRLDPRWAYCNRGEIHYGNWEDYGAEIPEPLPYAVVMATEMDVDLVYGGPHTPGVVESALNYAKGSYLTTILASWFGEMGYRATAQHSRNYDLLTVPLAIDAGLGELGRLGYLISDKYGARVRVFAVTTDMPLVPDSPVDLGVEKFCEGCMKCADSCPSRSIPHGEKTLLRGLLRWKLNEDTCFDYWAKVGTDCSVCMAVCPFSRPNRSIHRLVRWFVGRSSLAQRIFPYIDNWLYGKRWKPREVPEWIRHPRKKAFSS